MTEYRYHADLNRITIPIDGPFYDGWSTRSLESARVRSWALVEDYGYAPLGVVVGDSCFTTQMWRGDGTRPAHIQDRLDRVDRPDIDDLGPIGSRTLYEEEFGDD